MTQGADPQGLTQLPDDYPADSSTTGVVPATGQVTGIIDFPGDADWFTAHLMAGATYVFRLRGAANGGGTLNTIGDSKVGLDLYYPYGSLLALRSTNDVDGPVLTFRAERSGDYHIAVHGNGADLGSYTLVSAETLDTTAPHVASVQPAPGASGVSLTSNIVIKPDDLVTIPASGGFTLNGQDVFAGFGAGDGAHPREGHGDTLTIKPGYYLQPGATYTVQISGDIKDLAGNALQGATSFSFSTVAAVSVGGAGDDYLLGSGAGLHLDGGAGIDAAYYNDSAGAMTVTRAGGQVTVTAPGAASGDTLTGIERLLFPQHATALDIDGNAGQVYRLYAVLNRTPDAAGLGYWISVKDSGMNLHDLAQNFAYSGEYGQLITGTDGSHAAYLNMLYQNVLHRAPDSAGYAFWLQRLNEGGSPIDVLTAFTESAENQAVQIAIIGNGFDYRPYV